MKKAEENEPALNPNWVTFWRQIRAAADELRRIEAEQADGSGP